MLTFSTSSAFTVARALTVVLAAFVAGGEGCLLEPATDGGEGFGGSACSGVMLVGKPLGNKGMASTDAAMERASSIVAAQSPNA